MLLHAATEATRHNLTDAGGSLHNHVFAVCQAAMLKLGTSW